MPYHLVLKLIFIVNNLTNNNAEKTKPLIVYNTNGHPTCLNNEKHEHYFTGVFLTLFPFGDGGYLAKYKITISL